MSPPSVSRSCHELDEDPHDRQRADYRGQPHGGHRDRGETSRRAACRPGPSEPQRLGLGRIDRSTVDPEVVCDRVDGDLVPEANAEPEGERSASDPGTIEAPVHGVLDPPTEPVVEHERSPAGCRPGTARQRPG